MFFRSMFSFKSKLPFVCNVHAESFCAGITWKKTGKNRINQTIQYNPINLLVKMMEFYKNILYVYVPTERVYIINCLFIEKHSVYR